LSLIARLKERLRRQPPIEPAPTPAAAPPSTMPTETVVPNVVRIDMAATLSAAYPAEWPIAEAVTANVLRAIEGVDMTALTRRSPALKGFDWAHYLRCSNARIVRVLHALHRFAPNGRVLDFGSYFGNFSLACRRAGHDVHALDSYAEYGAAFAACVALQRDAGIVVDDFARTGFDLAPVADGTFDAVLCMGVIEHIAHTPKQMLNTLTRVLKPGGVLIIDTPNLGYLYKRLALLDGETIFCPIAMQYDTELPFEGHHREYTVDEVVWMLGQAGHDVVDVETFNYSQFAQTQLTGTDAEYHRAMQADPALRELILTVSKRR
jgi:2-polyprenyl-3-methyl-5-hydroxy-6-metoxy-1,4-benzoquinol methylase